MSIFRNGRKRRGGRTRWDVDGARSPLKAQEEFKERKKRDGPAGCRAEYG